MTSTMRSQFRQPGDVHEPEPQPETGTRHGLIGIRFEIPHLLDRLLNGCIDVGLTSAQDTLGLRITPENVTEGGTTYSAWGTHPSINRFRAWLEPTLYGPLTLTIKGSGCEVAKRALTVRGVAVTREGARGQEPIYHITANALTMATTVVPCVGYHAAHGRAHTGGPVEVVDLCVGGGQTAERQQQVVDSVY